MAKRQSLLPFGFFLLTIGLMIGAAASAVNAQEPPALTPGSSVWVTSATEEHVDEEQRGTVVSITPSTLILRVGATAQSIPLADVRRIETRDPLSNGIRNGAIVGAAGLGGFAAYLSQALCESSDGCLRHDLGRILMIAGLGASLGAAGGVTIDYAIKGRNIVYASPPPPEGFRVSPMFRRKGIGLRLSYSWVAKPR